MHHKAAAFILSLSGMPRSAGQTPGIFQTDAAFAAGVGCKVFPHSIGGKTAVHHMERWVKKADFVFLLVLEHSGPNPGYISSMISWLNRRRVLPAVPQHAATRHSPLTRAALSRRKAVPTPRP